MSLYIQNTKLSQKVYFYHKKTAHAILIGLYGRLAIQKQLINQEAYKKFQPIDRSIFLYHILLVHDHAQQAP